MAIGKVLGTAPAKRKAAGETGFWGVRTGGLEIRPKATTVELPARHGAAGAERLNAASRAMAVSAQRAIGSRVGAAAAARDRGFADVLARCRKTVGFFSRTQVSTVAVRPAFPSSVRPHPAAPARSNPAAAVNIPPSGLTIHMA